MTETPARRCLSLRTLRSVTSVFCFTLCVAFCLLWGRSYWWRDELSKWNSDTITGFVSWRGGGEYKAVAGSSESTSWKLQSQSAAERFAKYGRSVNGRTLEFKWSWGMNGFKVEVPHWTMAAVAGLAAIVLNPMPRYRFSLFDFLALTTFAALLAGLVAWLARLRS